MARGLARKSVSHASLATSRDRLKGRGSGARVFLVTAGMSGLPAFAPLGSVLDNPIGQGPLEANVIAGFLRFDPFMLQNLFTFRLKLLVQRGVLEQVVSFRRLWNVIRHSRWCRPAGPQFPNDRNVTSSVHLTIPNFSLSQAFGARPQRLG